MSFLTIIALHAIHANGHVKFLKSVDPNSPCLNCQSPGYLIIGESYILVNDKNYASTVSRASPIVCVWDSHFLSPICKCIKRHFSFSQFFTFLLLFHFFHVLQGDLFPVNFRNLIIFCNFQIICIQIP